MKKAERRDAVRSRAEEQPRRVPEQQQSRQHEQQHWVSGCRTSLSWVPEMLCLVAGGAEV